MTTLSTQAFDQLFNDARTHNKFSDRKVEPELLHKLYELMKWGPTSANCTPARLLFITSPEAKAKLAPCMSVNNRAKTLQAPVNAIVGMDLAFYDALPELFPHNKDARSWFVGNPQLIAETALRNSSLQGGYLLLAARGLGLDCGPMSGFDADAVNAAFFAGTAVRTNFICNLGYGDPAGVFPRSPRLDFDQACSIL